jgi:hypothetical protein
MSTRRWIMACAVAGALALAAVVTPVQAQGPPWGGPPFSAAATCDETTEICVRVATDVPKGPNTLRAQGFLHGVAGGEPGADLVAPLKPQNWRTSTVEYYNATKKTYGGKMTFLVREWFWANGGGEAPYTDWARYESYVRTLVSRSIAEGWPVDYWDVMNEPDAVGAMACPANDPCAAATQLEEIRHAVTAIRSVDPNAKIVVPSLNTFRFGPPALTGVALVRNLDIETVLDYLVLWNIKVDAISWHDINPYRHESYQYPVPQSVRDADARIYVRSPRVVLEQVDKVRAAIAARPSLGNLEIHINEYGPQQSIALPGWEAGWIGAMEDANVDVAMRSCWWLHEGEGFNQGCFGPGDAHVKGRLDGLITNGVEPKGTYWVHRYYADMTGTRVATSTTSDPQIGTGPPEDGAWHPNDVTSAFATRDDATSTVRALVGRHYSCRKSRDCNTGLVIQWDGYRPNATPAPGAVLVKWPYTTGSARVTVARIPSTNIEDALTAPVVVSSTMRPVATGQEIRVDLGTVADGEAYTVTVAPA